MQQITHKGILMTIFKKERERCDLLGPLYDFHLIVNLSVNVLSAKTK